MIDMDESFAEFAKFAEKHRSGAAPVELDGLKNKLKTADRRINELLDANTRERNRRKKAEAKLLGEVTK